MEKPTDSALETRAEAFTLRLLVEAVLMTMPPEDRRRAIVRFQEATESAVVATLSYAQRDETVHAMQQAARAQLDRLTRLGLPVPPPRQQS
jgi:hypothetical protein